MPGWPAAAEEPERRQLLEVDADVRPLPARAGAERDQVEPPDRGAAPAPRRDPRGAAGRRRRPGRHRPPRGGRGRRGRRRRLRARRRAARGGARVEPRGVLALPPRRRLRRPAAGARAGERARGAGGGRVRRRPARGRVRRRSSARSRSTRELGDEEAVGRCTRVLSRFHWFAGDGDAARRTALEAIAILEPLGESVELARAYSALSQLAMLAEDADAGARVGRAGARARDPARRREHARARARQHRQREDPARPPRTRRRCSRRTRSPTRPATGTRRRARSSTWATRSCCWVQPERGAPLRASRRSPTHASTRCTRSRSYVATTIAWLRLRAGEWDEAERDRAARARAGARVVAAAREDGPRRARGPPRRSGRRRAAGRPRRAGRSDAASCSGSCRRSSSTTEWALTTGAPMPAERLAQALDDEIRPRGAARGSARFGGAGRPSPGSTSTSTRRPRRPARGDARGATGWQRPTPSARSGWTYDRALMLSLLDDEESLVEAIEIARATRRRAADEARRRAHARARAARPARAARGDAREPGGPDRAPARGARRCSPRASRTRRSPTGWSSRREPPSTTWPPC